MISYLDTSAAMRLVVEETESQALASYLSAPLAQAPPRRLVASWLLHTELQRASRHPDEVDVEALQIVLDAVALVDVTRGDLLTAGTLPGQLRSPDAIHLAVALRVGAEKLLTYDSELAAAADAAGLAVVQPT